MRLATGLLLLALPLPTFPLMAQTVVHPSTRHRPPTHPAATKPANDPTAPNPPNAPPVTGPVQTAYALRYVDTQVGTGELALPGKIYSVHYTGYLVDGTKFDSSVDRGEPIDFPQGKRRVIAGWDTGFDGMRVGGKRRLYIPYQLAYGEAGRGPIPPKALLIFDVELVAQKDPLATAIPTGPPVPQATPDSSKPQPQAAQPQAQPETSKPPQPETSKPQQPQ